VPIDGVITGPRSVRWRPNEPATLVWVRALDNGDPKKKVPHRDSVLMLKAVDDRTVVLVDDVIYRGRTIRAAMEAVERLGQPTRILVAALIDRGARELPIRADIVGKNIEVGDGRRVNVLLVESDGADQVILTNWQRRSRIG
jgi:pyrimidine operon attenuation protein/uracil phosphoribosyltransferase